MNFSRGIFIVLGGELKAPGGGVEGGQCEGGRRRVVYVI